MRTRENLKAHDFLVGLSIDGPEMIHNRYRVYQSGRPTFYKVLHGLSLLQKYGVKFNIFACVTKESSQHPLEIYRFFKQAGVQFIQFSPIVERIPNDSDSKSGLRHTTPPILDLEEKQTKVPYMKGMKELIENGLPADRIMKIGEREWKKRSHENIEQQSLLPV